MAEATARGAVRPRRSTAPILTDGTNPATHTPVLTQATTGDGNDPTQPHPSYKTNQVRWEICRMVDGGTEAVRAAGERALPRIEHESEAAYTLRSTIASLPANYTEVKEVSIGLLLEKPPTLNDDNGPKMTPFWENVNGARQHAVVFSQRLLDHAINDGIAGIMTDYANIDAITGGDRRAVVERDLGARAYWILVAADDIYLPFYEVVKGQSVLTLFIRRERVERRKGKYGIEEVIFYRVYTRNAGEGDAVTITCETWVQEPNKRARPEGNAVTLRNQTEIPWSPLIAGIRRGAYEIVPPLMALAFQVLEYHAIKSGKRYLEQRAFSPALVRIGAKKNPETGEYDAVLLGPSATIEAPAIEGVDKPIYWLSPPIDVLEPAEASLTRLEGEMGLSGRGFLSPEKRGAETAKSKQIGEHAKNASLMRLRAAFKDCIELAIAHAAAFEGEVAGTIYVNDDFATPLMEPDVMRAWIELVKAGFDKVLAVRALKAGGRLPPDANVEEVARMWDEAQQQEAELALEREVALMRERQPAALPPGNTPPPPTTRNAP